MYKYGVKFCGGCDPTFERGEIFKKLAEAVSEDIFFENAQEGQLYQRVLVICGCDTCCVDMNGIQTKDRPVILTDKADYEKVLKELTAHK